MLLRKKQLRFWLIHVPVLLVYLLFFGVQVFFNLDINPDSSGGECQFTTAASADLSYSAFRNDNDNTHTHSEIRLNKRFQPSFVDFVPSLEVPRPDWHTILQTGLKDIAGHYVVGFDDAVTLRGPPALA
ncbi:MAG TPA: hypothetical protein VG842_05275 [Sediminibacterium sp.]|nr:hypothetical protein [Sediminibacterium sp.]